MYRGRELLQNQIAKNTFGYPSDGRPSFGVNPLSVFNGGRNGFWYDISDLRTLFQDVAGTTPVTDDGQQVQLILDKSGNGNHASQLAGATYHTDGTLHWLSFNGTSNYYSIPYFGLYANGSASVMIARDEKNTHIISTHFLTETSSVANEPVYLIDSKSASTYNTGTLIRNDANVVLLDTRPDSNLNGSSSAVVSSYIDSGSNMKRYRNGVLANDTNYTRSGTLSLDRCSIGFLDRPASGGYINNNVFGLVVVADELAETERSSIESFLARKSGVIL